LSRGFSILRFRKYFRCGQLWISAFEQFFAECGRQSGEKAKCAIAQEPDDKYKGSNYKLIK